MERTVKFELPANEAKQIQAEMRAQIVEIQRSTERIKQDQKEIARLETKTRATLDALAKMKTMKKAF